MPRITSPTAENHSKRGGDEGPLPTFSLSLGMCRQGSWDDTSPENFLEIWSLKNSDKLHFFEPTVDAILASLASCDGSSLLVLLFYRQPFSNTYTKTGRPP